MVEIVVSVVAKVSEYLVAPLGRQLGYLCNYDSNFEKLKEQVEKLVDGRERVQHLVDDAKRKGEEIEKDVEKWLISANKIVDEARGFLEDEETTKKRCFNLKKNYRLNKEAMKKMKAAVELQGEGKFNKISYSVFPKDMSFLCMKGYVTFESRMSTLKDILNALRNPNVNVVGVYGMGGVGKTVLVKEVARQAKEDKLFDEVVFTDVSQTPNMKKIQGEIADGLGLEFREESESGRARRLCERLKKAKNILIILDNVWANLDLEMVGIPLGTDHKGCKVLLTSRSLDVLSSEMDSQSNFLISALNDEEAWSLFKKVAGDCIEHCDLQQIAIDVAKECAGLPIALVTAARALRGKSLFEWKNALRELRRPTSSNFTGMQAVPYKTIELSYNHLEGEELKSTFLLCSLMGSAYNASVQDLLRCGLGLGLYKNINKMEEARDRVYTLVQKLKASSLLLDTGTNERFSMHDVVRDVATCIASRDQHAFTVTNEVVPKDWLDENILKNCTAISLHDVDVNEPLDGLKGLQLKFFYMSTKDPYLKIPDNFFMGITELRVLNLATMHLLSLPSSLLLLQNLRTLCLDSCILGDITIIGELEKLEILSLCSSDIELLPRETGRLTQLRLLDLSNCSRLKVISPNVISSFIQLEELRMVNSFVQWEVEGSIIRRSNASLDELWKLCHLTTLEIHIYDFKTLPKDLFFKKLERYKILIGDKWDWSCKYETSRMLKLKLNTNLVSEDGIITLLKRTEGLYLDKLKDVENIIYELDKEGFPQLKHLHVQKNPYLVCIIDSMKWVPCNAFPNLESLSLRKLINLEMVINGELIEETFCKLRILKVRNCDKLKNIFSFCTSKGLPQLQEIKVIECKNMEEIFSIGREDNVNDGEGIDKIHFSQLCSLTLRSLPLLSSFCSTGKVTSSQNREKPLNVDMWHKEVLQEDRDDTPVPLFNERVVFSNLEELKLSKINVEEIWHNQLPGMPFCSQKLTRLTIERCNKLKYLFPSSIARNFVQLQHLEIHKCAGLEEIIVRAELMEDQRKDIMFPQLTYLAIKDLESLMTFCSGSYIEFPSLKDLHIQDCPKLKTFVAENTSTTMVAHKQVENMKIQDTDIQALFNEKIAFPRLEELSIYCMDNLKMIWHNQLAKDSFRKLKSMKIEYCDNLTTLFSSTMSETLLRLELLTITFCNSLEEIFDLQGLNFEEAHSAQLMILHIQDLPKLKHIWNKDSQGNLSFQKLQSMRVFRCLSLKNLIPASIALSLFQLEVLEMSDCGVEEIVAKGEGEEVDAIFLFPRANFLSLRNLPELQTFYPGIHTTEWPALKNLEVYRCDRVEIFASESFGSNKNSDGEIGTPVQQQPLFLVEKVFPHLERLALSRKDINMLKQGPFPEELFFGLKILEITDDESAALHLISFGDFSN